MYRRLVLKKCLWFLFSMILFSCKIENSADTDSFETLKTDFIDPPSDYRSAPFMVWNTNVTTEKIDMLLGDLKSGGCGGAFMHPRPGLITEYLSDEWYALTKHCVDKGKELDMNIYIYDENSYPSGFGGGHVPAQMPESYNQGHSLQLVKSGTIPENTADYYTILMMEGDRFIDITSSVQNYKGKKADFYLYKKMYYDKSNWYAGFSYVDLLYPGVTQKFMEVTMPKYEENLKEEFGKTLKGIFTDEPEISSFGGLKWTPDLFEQFKKKWGYDLKTSLPCLNEEIGDWKCVRNNYEELLLELFIDRWSKPWYEYCEKNNLRWTGHYWEHGWPTLYMGPDNMAMYAWHQMPGIDMLFNQFDDQCKHDGQFGNIRAVKELRSAANQMGRERTLSETYGGSGWDMTFKDLKRLADWEYVLGVNFLNLCQSLMTMTGARKYDYPPFFTYNNSWWPNYRTLNDYYARLSLALSKGKQQNDILVLEPTTTIWSYFSYTGGSHDQLAKIGDSFHAFVTNLERKQVEYDLGSEDIIKNHGTVEGKQLIVGKCAYKTVVIPPMVENITSSTWRLLKDFVGNGGKLVTFSSPDRLNGSINHELVDFFTQDHSNLIKAIDLTDDMTGKHFLPENLSINHSGGYLLHHRRMYSDGEMVFLVNSSMDEAVSGEISLQGKSLIELDAFSGKIFDYPNSNKQNALTAQFHLEPAGSLLLFCSNSKKYKADKKAAIGPSEEIPPVNSNPFVKRIRENALNVDFCDITLHGKTTRDIYFTEAAAMLFEAHGMGRNNPWRHAVQYKRTIVDRDTFKTGGATVTYHFSINGHVNTEGMRLVAERPELWIVKVNGEKVIPIKGEWWFDKSFGVYAIDKQVKQGKNSIEFRLEPISVFAEIEPVYVIGDFSVMPQQRGFAIQDANIPLSTGSWKQQGMPFYAWEVSYSNKYTLEHDSNDSHFVRLNNWKGSLAEVFVNGEKAGIIYAEPNELNVTGFLKKGENEIDVRVVGTMQSLLGPHYGNSPHLGVVGPFSWAGRKIPGNEYQFEDYGLMSNFSLIRGKNKYNR